MIEGYHVVGHHIQETWEALLRRARTTVPPRNYDGTFVPIIDEGALERAVRDIRVLVAFLDADAGVFGSLVDALTGTEEDGQTAQPAEANAASATLTEAMAGQRPAPAAGLWPVKEFGTVSELGAWVHQRHKVAMTDILAAAGKKTVPELTIATAKAAVEKVLAARAS